MPFISYLLHGPPHYSTTRFLCVMDTHLLSIHISHLQHQGPFLIYSQVLSTSAGIYWHFIDTACSNSFCTTVSFNFQVFLLGGIRMGLTGFADTIKSQTSNLCCVMHSSLLITFHFCVLDVFLLCSPYKDEANLCMITSRWKSNKPAFVLAKENVGNYKFVGYTKIKNEQHILVYHTKPTTSRNTLEPWRMFTNMSVEMTTKH